MKRHAFVITCLVAVMLACVVPVGKPVPESAPTITPTATRLAFVTATRSLNVRFHPGEQERVIGYLYNADAVTLTGSCRAGWAQIRWRQGVAWVNAKFLSDNDCQTKER